MNNLASLLQSNSGKLMSNPEVDIIIWITRGYPGAIRNPEMYGWVREMSGEVKGVSVKKALNNPSQDPIIVGTFTFKKSDEASKGSTDNYWKYREVGDDTSNPFPSFNGSEINEIFFHRNRLGSDHIFYIDNHLLFLLVVLSNLVIAYLY